MYSLRELAFEDKNTLDEVLSDTVTSAGDNVKEMVISDINTVDQLVIQMLGDIKPEDTKGKIDPQRLVDQYRRLITS